MPLINLKPFLLLLLFLSIPFSSGLVEGFRDNMYPTHHVLYKDGGMKMKLRKLFSHEFVLDYDEAGANPKHTKKPGKGP
ncbi:hypothetical protein HN51_052342 [Arachis hypogaea]|uniref:Uncharacterized protein n=1 Tax=Arachis hypogaea TaxID=3818 RepID=A0A445CBA6_ARAHY|nr:uncharacterized protein LOC107608260 [Arachis ipaensis]XP_025667003.1 uncharacterized protein LOC112765309 [Arachis hypogaea]QHN93682.1 uncharacterized protein DS421_17g594740 [Arachis hypogaea]RYR48133.1 hypothetical protein Ahy_A07g034126 [Arachis hypogaea]